MLTAIACCFSCSAFGKQSAMDTASGQAAGIATLWWWMLYAFTLVFVITIALLFLGVLRAKKHPGQLSRKASSYLVVIAGVVIPLATVITLVGGSLTLGRSISEMPPSDAIPIKVIGHMWWWEVHYLDDNNESIAVTANEIVVPVGKPVKILLASNDVIHSFWVPQLHGKTDMIPGRVNMTWFTADKLGVFRGQCAEFCGTQHSLMAFTVESVSPPDFDKWLEVQSQQAAVPATKAQQAGLSVFMTSGCAGCHTIRGTAAIGEIGPDLTHFGSRSTLAAVTKPNTIGHLAGWIADPQRIKPGNRMPRTQLAAQDLLNLVAYLQNLH